MPYKPMLSLGLEWEGATFVFGPADKAWSRLAAAGAQVGTAEIDSEDVPAELIEPLCELFVEGVMEWEGVEGPDGNALACNVGTRKLIPSPDKIQISSAYLAKMQELEGKKTPSVEPPTSSEAPESSPEG